MGNDTRRVARALEPEDPLFGLGYAEPLTLRTYERLDGERRAPKSAMVAEETPVALVYNGWPHVVMMCTPADVEDFALGFTLTEEIVASADEIERVNVVRYSQGIEVQLSISTEALTALRERGRSLIGRTGCGLCGVTTIGEMLRSSPPLRQRTPIASEAIFRAGNELPRRQQYNAEAGAVHAAAWATNSGEIVLAREDVGRHNALDKLIGALVRAQIAPDEGFALITSRASYELIQKCAVARIALLAAVSRPTGLAVRMADASGMTLAALLRGTSVNIYSHPERITRHA